MVLGVPDPAPEERSESEDSEGDREEQTADRIAERLGLTQFLGAGTRSAQARDASEGIRSQRELPKAAVAAAEAALEAQQGSLLVSSLCRWCHGAALLGV